MEPPHYAVRYTRHANREAAEAMVWIEEQTGDSTLALEWYDGLQAAAGTLGEQPRRYAILEDASRLLGFEARRLLYRRTTSSSAYHLYYRIEDENSEGGPRVTIVHVRHSARDAMTPEEARELRQG